MPRADEDRDYEDCAPFLKGVRQERRSLGILNQGGLKSQSPEAVILKPVGRIFEISDSNPIRGKCGKCEGPSFPEK